MQRIACTLIVCALSVVCCLVALLLGGALSPGRVPPMLAFCAACCAGASLILAWPCWSSEAPRTAGGLRGALNRRLGIRVPA